MTDTRPAGPLQIGQVFNAKYEIVALLGKGGHAWVYHGHDSFLNRHTAIKVIPRTADSTRDMRKRAQREARMLLQIKSENVVGIIDAGMTDDDGVFIVMELLRGRTLREVMHHFRRLDLREALQIGVQVADGLEAAHKCDVIHRDLKPENIFVLNENAVKVLDFGIGKFIGPGAVTTQKELLLGTMMYMSPEHLQGLGANLRSDIFALGTLLYEAMSGYVPCKIGMAEPTLNAMIFAQVGRSPPLLDELVAGIPRFVARAIQRMMAKAPADRYASMAEVAAVLRALLARLDLEAEGPKPTTRELWLAPPERASSVVLSDQTTVQKMPLIEPPTAPPVTLSTPCDRAAANTDPVSRPAFDTPATTSPGRTFIEPGQATQPLGFPAILQRPSPSASAAPVSRVEHRASIPQATVEERAETALLSNALPSGSVPETRQPSTEVAAALSRNSTTAVPTASGQPPAGSLRVSQPDSARPPLTQDLHRSQQPHLGLIANSTVLWSALALGTFLGLAIEISRYASQPRLSAATVNDQKIVVVRAQPSADVGQPPTAVSATAPDPVPAPAVAEQLPQVISVQSSIPLISSLPRARVAKPSALPPVTAALHGTTSQPAKPASKPASSAPASGLWDMSDLEQPVHSKSPPEASSGRRRTLIFGGDQLLREPK